MQLVICFCSELILQVVGGLYQMHCKRVMSWSLVSALWKLISTLLSFNWYTFVINCFGRRGAVDITLLVSRGFEPHRKTPVLKLARVVPIHKKGPKHDYTNYRPISVIVKYKLTLLKNFLVSQLVMLSAGMLILSSLLKSVILIYSYCRE